MDLVVLTWNEPYKSLTNTVNVPPDICTGNKEV